MLSQQVGLPKFQASLHGLLGQQQLQQAVLLQVQWWGLLQLILAVSPEITTGQLSNKVPMLAQPVDAMYAAVQRLSARDYKISTFNCA